MNPDQLNRIDLNLLVAFNALMDERNVSRAAERLHVTQPAMSKTLQRLRGLFNDQLFIRTPKGLDPTPKSLELHPLIVRALDQLIKVLTPAEFTPANLERSFSIAAADPLSALFIPKLMEQLVEEAPGVHLKLVHYSADSIQALSQGTVDFVCGVMSDNLPAGIHGRQLSEDHTCIFVRKNHPFADKGEISTEEMVQYGHIKPWFKGINDRGPMDLYLKSQGLQRTINLEASHFMTIRQALLQSDNFLVGFKYTWWNLLGLDSVVPLEFKEFDTKAFTTNLFWDERNHNDPASKWLRERIVSISTEEVERMKESQQATEE
ncbi:MAG: LysR family transcriptional regulator [Motiliproteus sp.]